MRANAIATTAGTAPEVPTTLVLHTKDGLPELAWTQPLGASVLFYRIYRDGTAIADRYASTVTNDPHWIDADPGPAPNPGHTYRVAAVGTSLSESALSAPIVWPDEVTP